MVYDCIVLLSACIGWRAYNVYSIKTLEMYSLLEFLLTIAILLIPVALTLLVDNNKAMGGYSCIFQLDSSEILTVRKFPAKLDPICQIGMLKSLLLS